MEPIRAGIYARISHDPNKTGEGVDHQETICRRQLAARAARDGRPIKVERVWKETDASAWTGRPRKSYLELLQAIRLYEIDLLIVWHGDRLHRRAKEFEAFLDVLDERATSNPLQVVTVNGGNMDFNTASGRLAGRIAVSVAQHESDIKRDRIKARFDERARLGQPLGGRKLYGYDTHRRIVPAEAAFIKQAAGMLVEGVDGNEICRRLNDAGSRTVTGRLWTRRTLTRVLVNPGLTGAVVHRNEVVPNVVGKWEPILASREQERIKLHVRSWEGPSRGGRPQTALLSGILRCGKCGSGLYKNRRADGQRIYWCQPSPNHDRGCGGVSVKADPIDAYIVEAALARIPELPPISPSDQARLDAKLATIRDLEARMTDYEKRADEFDARRLARILADLETKVVRARTEANQLAQSPALRALGLHGTDLRKAWPGLSFNVRREILKSLLETVTIRPVGRSRSDHPKETHMRISDTVWKF